MLLAQAPTCVSTRKIRYETHVARSCEEVDRDGQGVSKLYQNVLENQYKIVKNRDENHVENNIYLIVDFLRVNLLQRRAREASWRPLGGSWRPLGRLLGASWGLLGPLGRLLGASWAPFGRLLGALGAIEASKSSQEAPKRPPRGPQEAPKRPHNDWTERPADGLDQVQHVVHRTNSTGRSAPPGAGTRACAGRCADGTTT